MPGKVMSASQAAGEPKQSTLKPEWRGTQDCVHCGLCLTSCPTYLTTGVEMSSPRGRIWLMRALEEGEARLSPLIVKHLDQCVGCLACQQACPSKVPYAELLEAARHDIGQHFHRGVPDTWFRSLLLRVFPYPGRLGPILSVLYWVQRLGVARALRRFRLVARVAPRLAGMQALLPRVPARA